MVFGFCGYSEISKFNPQVRYFLENVNLGIFIYGHIWGMTSKIEYLENESPGCEFHLFKWRSKVLSTFPYHFRVKIGHIDRSEKN